MSKPETSRCCCRPTGETPSCAAGATPAPPVAAWIVGTSVLAGREVPQVSTQLRIADRINACRVRWAIGRMGYRVPPGLYAVGAPTADSPVLVSANYKMSFDRLRSQLAGLDAWLLVLDTQGVNVWCAAGKGTFGTDELVRRIEQAGLLELTRHRTVVVPQLGATGVAAHEVRERTGVRVVYGPVRAADLPEFLGSGMKATPAMRRVRFTLRDRIVLVPVEIATTVKWFALLATAILLLSGLGRDGYASGRLLEVGVASGLLLLAAWLGALVLGPALLPWLPGRPFSLKGIWVGLALLMSFTGLGLFPAALSRDWPSVLAWWLVVPSMASLLLLKFTGASTFTSLSGTLRETRFALPVQAVCAVLGLGLWLAGRFL